MFCSMHRVPDFHGCTFDFKEHSKKDLEKTNPLITIKKVDLI